jgi:hypothetical protein
MAECTCNIAANFPGLQGLNLGIISVSLRSSQNISVMNDGLKLFGPATGDLSITAYAPLNTGEELSCPGRAGVSFEWDQRIACDEVVGGNRYGMPIFGGSSGGSALTVYFIARAKDKAYKEGDVTSQISMTDYNSYETFSASAASGPFTMYLKTNHRDGYEFSYTGGPVPINKNNGRNPTRISWLSDILPGGSKLYLSNFTWEYTPVGVPTVSYSFIFSYSA